MPDATYQVRIAGTIPAELLSELRDLSISVEPPETVLHGRLPDQPSMARLVTRLQGLGLRLIEVRRLPDEDEPAPAH